MSEAGQGTGAEGRFSAEALLAHIAVLPLDGEEYESVSVHWAPAEATAELHRLIRAARAAMPADERLEPIVLRMECLECEGELDCVTRSHVEGADHDPDCRHAGGVVPQDSVGVTLHCPRCDSRDLYEVNVGEVWDELREARLTGRTLLVEVHQDGGMDREGDGYACGSCRARLTEPAFTPVEFEYGC